MRVRTMVGSVAILLFLVFWIGAAGFIGDHLPKGRVVQLIYFVVAGVGWGVPLIPLLSWMNRDR